ncbi:hypothetical protein F7C95_08660 [Opitutia bacterium ISCC 51]|nr:hypothetical protein F7C95_08660 [Opitutae bacterium ISCC 51]QXD30006.1 hypothetical protein GA003_08605 [Opitutae bacterium ISCC 52]
MSAKTYELEFGCFTMYENYILGVPKLYAEVGIEEAREINRIIGTQYTKPYGYIGDRKKTHSVDPRVYLMANKENKFLKCIAVIVQSESSRQIAELEKQAADAAQFPFGIFNDLEAAAAWTESVLETFKD